MRGFGYVIDEVFKSWNVQDVLDLWAGNGKWSRVCAERWARVDAVDSLEMKWFFDESWFKDQLLVNLHICKIEEFELNKKYDLVILSNIIMFLDKEWFLSDMFPRLISSLNEGARVLISFFLPDDELYLKCRSQYCVEDFNDSWLVIEKSYDELFEDDHEPMGKHIHHIQYLVLRKR